MSARLLSIPPDMPPTPANGWVDVCALEEITPDTGVAALVDGRQIAIVRVGEGDQQQVYAVGNFDPFSQAFVIARGIVGDRGGIPKIASPIFKQSFDLRTGQCLDDRASGCPRTPSACVTAGLRFSSHRKNRNQ